MSVSPQSLARTRDRRSHRVPAKFGDFSDIPPLEFNKQRENTVLAVVPVDHIKMKSKSAAKRPPSDDSALTCRVQSQQEPQTQQQTQPQQQIKPAKKAKGLSLIVKQDNNNKLQVSNNHNANIHKPAINNITNGTRAHLTVQQPQYRILDGFGLNTQINNMSSRLMLNEPIYLPQTIKTIDPITSSPKQLARKRPFASKKTEAYIAYQESKKFESTLSTYKALVKITEHLGLRDLLKLRQVNTSWKLIIDTDTVWKHIYLDNTIYVNDWPNFLHKLEDYHTTDLTIDNYDGDLFMPIIHTTSLRSITIKTFNVHQHARAINLISNIYELYRDLLDIRIEWSMKIYVSKSGLAQVPIACNSIEPLAFPSHYTNIPFVNKYSALLIDGCNQSSKGNEAEDVELVELGDIEQMYQDYASALNANCRIKLKFNPV